MAKTFVLADEALNNYGFWLPMSGADLKQFERNPIMLWMHHRSWRGTKDEILPIGTWDNIRIEEGKLLADAVFDQDDDFAAVIENKVEAGIIKMASLGLQILTTSNESQWIKPGQARETPIKWRVREASIVDIGANDNSVMLAIYEGEELLNLSDTAKDCPVPILQLADTDIQTNTITMKKLISFFALAAAAQEEEVLAMVQKQADDIARLTGENTHLATLVSKHENDRQEQKRHQTTMLLDAATQDGRIDAPSREMWQKLFEKDFDNTKAVIESLAVRSKAADLLDKSKNQSLTERDGLEKLSWDELDKSGKLEYLKEKHADLFEVKFREKFGKDLLKP